MAKGSAFVNIRHPQYGGLPDGRQHRRVTRGIEVVYYIQLANGLIKIGTTADMVARTYQLRTRFGAFTPLAVEFGGRELERERHEQFAHLRDGQAETFRPADDLLDFIADIRRQHNIA